MIIAPILPTFQPAARVSKLQLTVCIAEVWGIAAGQARNKAKLKYKCSNIDEMLNWKPSAGTAAAVDQMFIVSRSSPNFGNALLGADYSDVIMSAPIGNGGESKCFLTLDVNLVSSS